LIDCELCLSGLIGKKAGASERVPLFLAVADSIPLNYTLITRSAANEFI